MQPSNRGSRLLAGEHGRRTERVTWVADKPPKREQSPDTDMLVGLLRPVAVAAFHMGAGAQDLRVALERAVVGIFDS